MSRNSTRTQNNDVLVAKIYGQATKIRADIMLCSTASQSQNSRVGPDSYRRFPACGTAANANYDQDGYCTNVTINNLNPILANAKNLRCLEPSSPSVWDNSEGSFFPEPLRGFEEWKYSIVASGAMQGVSLLLTTAGRATDADIDWVLRTVRDRFGPNEAAVMNRTGANEGTLVACGAPPARCNTLRIILAR